jgi:isoleucyl-tRNA synthetase
MDKWVLSKLNTLVQTVTASMDSYDVVLASRASMEFVTDLSTWYLRRSREQLKEGTNKEESLHVFGHVLYTLAQLFAPFAPFFAESVYHQVVDSEESIHLTDWPKANTALIDKSLEEEMDEVRKIVERVHATRKDLAIKVKQPLAKVIVTVAKPVSEEVIRILLDETNVKIVEWKTGDELFVELDTKLTPELLAEGEARELIRSIQKLRKEAGLTLTQDATVTVPKVPKGWQQEIEQKTHTQLKNGAEIKLET